MKISIKSIAAIFMAMIIWTGCIETEVAPEIKELREAQAAYLKAKADLAAAEAQAQLIQNTFDQAMNDIALAAANDALREQVAATNVALKEAEAALQTAELELQESIAALEKFIAEQGIEDAMEYLMEYEAAASLLNALVADELVAQAELNKAQMILDNPNSSWKIDMDYYQDQLDQAGARLVAEQALLVSLEAAVDPSQFDSQIEEARTMMAEAEATMTTTENNAEAKTVEADLAYDGWDKAYDLISNYTQLESSLIFEEQDILEAQEDVTYDQNQISLLEDQIEVLVQNLADAQAALEPLEARLADSVAKTSSLYNIYLAAQSAYEIAQNNYEADNSQENLDARDEALDARDNAYDAYLVAQNGLSTIEAARNDAYNQVNNAQWQLNSANDNLVAWNESLIEGQAFLQEEIEERNSVQAQLSALEPAYTDAQENIATLYANALALEVEADAIWNEYWYAYYEYWNLSDLVYYLQNSANNLELIIENQKDEIAEVREEVAYFEELMEDAQIDEAEQQAYVAYLTAELERIQNEIEAQQAVVDRIKALLDAALNG
ncbi:MAG TPA: hypothetical protein VD927_05715 [Chryseosolibacter sp.]|nr:hypothetical protein [Chryseosolibacter sp.]